MSLKRGDTVYLAAGRKGKQQWRSGPAKVMSVNADGTYDVKNLTTKDSHRGIAPFLLTPVNVEETERKKRKSIKKGPYSPSVVNTTAAEARMGPAKANKMRKSGGAAGEAIASEPTAKHEKVSLPASLPSSKTIKPQVKKDVARKEKAVVKQEKRQQEEEHYMDVGSSSGVDREEEEEEEDLTVRCQFCAKAFVLGGPKKEKKVAEMQEHVNRCLMLSKKRAKEEDLKAMKTSSGGGSSIAPRWCEEIPSHAAKALESCLTVPDPTFLVSGLTGWILAPSNKVAPAFLTKAIFNSLKDTRSAYRAETFYHMLRLSLEAHPPHLVANAWTLADATDFKTLVKAVATPDAAPEDYVAYRSQVLALAYLVNMFKMERRSLGDSPPTLKNTNLDHLVRALAQDADNPLGAAKRFVRWAVSTCAGQIQLQQSKFEGNYRYAAVRKGIVDMPTDKTTWFIWADAPEETATEVMSQLAGLLLEMLLEEERSEESCNSLITSAVKNAAASYRVDGSLIRHLFLRSMGPWKIEARVNYEEEVLGSFFDDIMDWEKSQGMDT